MIRHTSRFFPHLGVLLAALIGSTAGAANFTVSTLDDSGPGSLRQAIELANSNPGADTITFSVSGTITLDSTLPTITDPDGLTINGRGISITVSGNYVRVMIVNSGATLNLEHLTVTGGDSFYSGGISNSGTLTVTDCTFSGNRADSGGGISNSGTLTVTDSSFSNNITNHYGGGISNGGTLTVTNSTFSGNSAAFGGGISNSGTLTVTNSTFSGNQADAACGFAEGGGGIRNSGTLTVTHSTFSGNKGSPGSGIHNYGGILNLANTIVANSEGSADCVNTGTLNATGINLVEDGSCGASSDTEHVHFITGDPKLGDLANNSGPTETLALLPGSPAIDTADDTICAAPPVNSLDQRGVNRQQQGGAHCDIGAFELIQSAIPMTPFSVFNVRWLVIDPNRGALFLWSTFTLSNGIHPVNEEVTLTLANATMTIPAGSFHENRYPSFFAFAGQLDNVWLEALIKPLGSNRFVFQAVAYGAPLGETPNPVTVELTIGDDRGTTTAQARTP